MKFLVDVGVGRHVEEWLEKNGHDTKPVRAFNPAASDDEILLMAATESRMVITMDKDFGELIYNSGKTHAGVLILRLEDAKGKAKAEIVETILRRYEDKILNRFCVYQDGKLRVR